MIQLQALNKVIIDNSLSIFVNNGIDRTYFPEYEAEYDFIVKHTNKYGNVPDDLTVTEKFPGFDLIEMTETDAYIIDSLREEWVYNQALPILNRSGELMQLDSMQAVQFLLPAVQALLKNSTFVGGTDIVKNAKDRFNWSMKLKDQPGLLGETTGFEEVDDIIGGLLPGAELFTIVGRPNEGKSWILLSMLTAAWKKGRKVLLYSGEMDEQQVGARFDSLVTHISNQAINRGLLAGSNIKRYEDHTNVISESGVEFIVITPDDLGGKFLTPSVLDTLIQKHKPHVVGIDQLSLTDTEQEGSYRIDTKTKYNIVTKDLFNLSSKHKVPVLLAAQATRKSEDNPNRIPGLADIAEADNVGQNVSRCLSIAENNGIITFKLVKNRYGAKDVMFEYFWDKDTGVYSYAGDGLDEEDEDNESPNVRVRELRIKTSKRNKELKDEVKSGIEEF